MKKFLSIAYFLVVTTVAPVSFIASTVLGQETKTADVNSSSLDSLTARVDKLFAPWDKPGSPGCALGIVKDRQLIYKRGYGMANLDYSIPLSTKSVFYMASISKQFTAMSILLLARQGKISLDDEIQKYLPEVPRYQSPITIQHLIHHTSGIRNYVQLAELAGMWGTRGTNVRLTDDDYLGLIARQKELNFKPGEEYLYSNSGYFLLGLIVKRVSGTSLREFAEENIFKPLGMTHTHFHDDRDQVVRNRVTAYLPGSNGRFAATINDNESVGATGLYTSVEDLFLWDQNFYNNKLGGGQDFIGQELSTGTLNNGEKTGYAFGLDVDIYKGLKRIGHGGSGGGFNHEMDRFPEQNFSVIRLCNAGYDATDGLGTQTADIFLADQFRKDTGGVNKTIDAAPAIISIPEKELASLTGLYVDPIRGDTHRFYMKDGKLMLKPSNGHGYVLSPLGQNRFKTVGAAFEIAFARPIVGGRMQEKITYLGRKSRIYDEVQDVAPTVQLAEYTGKYVSEELGGATYTLGIKDGKLSLEIRNGITVFSDRGLVLAFEQASKSEVRKNILLPPPLADVFVTYVDGESVIFRFTRNQQNAVSGFTLTTETVRRLRFNKL